MRLRPPPGRVGRPWLLRRLEVARTAADVLDQKRRALLREQHRLEPLVAEARRAWEAAAADASAWLERATVLAGERRIDLALVHGGAPAELEVRWVGVLGVRVPENAPVLELGDGGGVAGVGGSAALPVAVAAHRRALRAAVRFGALRAARDRIADEVALTTRRLQAIERRWIPAHDDALRALELALDEAEREDAVRTRWAVRRSDGSA
jgi:V/A-type H+-transporting ATPase subunit D